jgi:hypothetical protein
MKTNGIHRVLIPGNGQDNQAIAMAIKLGIELSRKVANDKEYPAADPGNGGE